MDQDQPGTSAGDAMRQNQLQGIPQPAPGPTPRPQPLPPPPPPPPDATLRRPPQVLRMAEEETIRPPANPPPEAMRRMDPGSAMILDEAIPRNHKHPGPVQARIRDGLNYASDSARRVLDSSPGMTFEELLYGLLLPGERLLLGGRGLEYEFLRIFEEGGKGEPEHWGEGRLMLTDRRILFLSCMFSENASITPSQLPPKRPPGYYGLGTVIRDSASYTSVPVEACRGISFHYKRKIVADAKVSATPPCLQCYWCCCAKAWTTSPLHMDRVEERILNLGLILPPWGKRGNLEIHISFREQLAFVRDFCGQLQVLCPSTVRVADT